MSGRRIACRRQQQRRACAGVRHRLDPWVGNRASASLARLFHVDEIGDAQARNIHGRAVIPIAIGGAVLTPQPPAPLHIRCAVLWRAIGLGGLPAPRTGVARPAWIFGMEPQTNEAAFVAQQSPDLPPDRGIVLVVAPASPHAFAAPGRFERFQGFHREQRAVVDRTEEQQHIAGQMREGAVAQFVLVPTAVNLTAVQC